jgi:type VI secretion system secreted protein VgrG
MSTYIQADRWMTVTTPLGLDDLLLVGFAGHEAISQLFSFQLDLVAENQTVIPFEQLLGQKMTINLSLPEDPSK